MHNNLQPALLQWQKSRKTFFMECIVSHETNEDMKHPSAHIKETTYRIRWGRFNFKDESFKLIRYISRRKVVR